jgi:hypothetical protein
MKSKAKHKFFYSVGQPSVILGSSFQQFQSFLGPWNLLENNFWKGRQTQNCFDVQRMSTRKVHLSLEFVSHPYLPGDQAPTISSQVVAAPSNMSILRMSHPHLLDHEMWDNTALQDAGDAITDILCAWFYNIKTE